ncbi:5-hydroxytryptamine receptor 2B-like [Mytilus californianus]|uniref:5-hydroxytryptamine receptor 2B-like n=1 Tax=Mytilus californianus TaxID=6549 RepID=UPI002245B3ED|nr:5-hydroxytryptamine receptor 2B-like [Mytilus californianus]
MASNFTNGTHTSLREIEYQRFLDKYIPTTIVLIVMSVVGTIGNIHTILVYMLSPIIVKYSVRVFIIWLAFIDLTACLFCMPFEIFDIRYEYTFASVGACKFFKFLNHIVTAASTILLTTIAFERYKTVVKKLPISIANSKRSNVISAVLVGISMIWPIPVLVFYGLNKNETDFFWLSGKDCRLLPKYQYIRDAGVCYIITLVIGLVCVGVCIVSYGRILCEICTQKKWRKSLRKKPVLFFNPTSDIRLRTTQVISTIENGEVKKNQVKTEIFDMPSKKSTHASHNLGNATRLTISLMIATAISYTGHLLYVFGNIVQMLNPTMYQNSIQPVFDILVRAYFINNVTNPIVFSLFDRSFRQECLKLYGKISRRNKAG